MARSLGFWSALSVTSIDVLYVITGVIWLVSGGWRTAEPLAPAEPYLSILEFMILATAPVLVVVTAAIHAYAPAQRKIYALTSVAFMTAFALLTVSVHYAQLVIARRLPPEYPAERAVLRFYPWPSLSLGLDLLAWDLFFGLAMLFAAPVFAGAGPWKTPVRIALRLSGALCVVGFLGPLLDEMRLQYLAITGYAFVLPVACALLALLFKHAPTTDPTR